MPTSVHRLQLDAGALAGRRDDDVALARGEGLERGRVVGGLDAIVGGAQREQRLGDDVALVVLDILAAN